MADRVTYRERTAGVCVAIDVGDIKAVSITEPRVKFIRGWLTGGTDPADGSVECGDGKLFCMEVTGTPAEKLSQISEAFHRAHDARITAGLVELSYTDMGSTYTRKMFFGNVDTPTEQVVEYGPGQVLNRGYLTSRLYDELDPIPPMQFSDNFTTAEILSYGLTDTYFRYAERERALWDQERDTDGVPISQHGEFEQAPLVADGSTFISPYDTDASTFISANLDFFKFRTAYSNLLVITSTATAYRNAPQYQEKVDADPYSSALTDGTMVMQIGNQVAFIDDDGSGNPFSDGNRLFMACYFSAVTIVGSPSPIMRLTSDSSGADLIDSAKSLKLALEGGQPTCKIYAGFLGLSGATIVSAEDFIVTPTLWWPYKKTDGTPAWDETDGTAIGDISS